MVILQVLVIALSFSSIFAGHQVTHVRGDSRRNEAIIWCYVTAKPPMKLSWKSNNHKILSVSVVVGLLEVDSEWKIVQGGKLHSQKDFVKTPGQYYGMLKRRQNDYAFALVIPTSAPGLRRSGNFICEVGNSPPVSNKTLAIGFSPTLVPERLFQANNSEKYVLESSNHELNCPFEGDPVPKISWITPNNVHKGIEFDESEQRIKISSIKHHHLGSYECVAANIHGKDKIRYSLKLGEVPKLLDTSKYENILESFVEYLVVPQNKKITLNCPVSGKPQPKICWYRRDSKRLKATSQSIRIRAPKNRNSTFFSCFAANQFGHTEKMFYVFKEGQIPVFKNADIKRDVSVMVGDKILLDCSSFGVPVPEVSWFKVRLVIWSENFH